jgi:hypothetical protein
MRTGNRSPARADLYPPLPQDIYYRERPIHESQKRPGNWDNDKIERKKRRPTKIDHYEPPPEKNRSDFVPPRRNSPRRTGNTNNNRMDHYEPPQRTQHNDSRSNQTSGRSHSPTNDKKRKLYKSESEKEYQ